MLKIMLNVMHEKSLEDNSDIYYKKYIMLIEKKTGRNHCALGVIHKRHWQINPPSVFLVKPASITAA